MNLPETFEFSKEELETIELYQALPNEQKFELIARYQDFIEAVWNPNLHLRQAHEAEHDLKYIGFLEI